MPPAVARAGKVLGFLALAAYPLLVHAALTSTARWATVAAVLLSIQLIVLGGIVVARSHAKYKWLLAGLALLILAASWQSAHQSLMAVSGVPHAIINATLLVFFAGSLLVGREAIVTRLARKIRGPLPDELVVYTRRVTCAWSIFFAGQLLGSVLLFLYAPLDVWSLFVNLLNAPLTVLMFALEYGYRITRFRHYRHGTIADLLRLFTQRDAPVSKRGP
jgi:uncharacterized membrane protein